MKTMYKKFLYVLILLPFMAYAQGGTVSGTVTDGATGMGLPGVNIIVKGTSNGATTDFDGNYSLSRLNNGDVIEFSYIGYISKSVNYTGQNKIDVNLQEDSGLLDEVTLVAVGYGAVRKRDMTGSVTQISAKDFNKGANVTADNLLNGRVAGVTINAGGGSLGARPEIRIRGGSSLAASNDPLVVVDGLPMSVDVLNRINPNDIESFSILKDASATAIYGTRASNGVILITTKKGGKTLEVEYNTQYGSGTKFNTIETFNADQFRNFIGGIDANPALFPGQVLSDRLGNANTNWQEEIYRRTDFIDNNLSLRGSLFNMIPTRLTIGNTYQEGLRLTDNLNRNTFALNLNPSFFDNHLKLRLSVNYTNTRRRNAPAVEGSAIFFDPTQPVFDPESPFDGFFEFRNGPGIANFAPIAPRNPVATLLQTNNRSVNRKLFGNFEVDYKFHFLPELRAVVNLGYDRDSGFSRERTSRFALSGPQRLGLPIGNDAYSDGVGYNKLLDGYLVYTKTFGELNFDITGGYSYQKFESNSFTTRNRLNPDDEPVFTRFDDLVFIGFFGRTNLNFKDKYLLTLSYRRDGTSRFGANNRWGNFPAVAFAWKMKEEFFADNTKISDLKLRLGWGITGQQEIPNSTFFLPQFNIGDQNSQYLIGGEFLEVGVPAAFNTFLKWEETYTYNAGIDFGFFDNRLTATLDAYYKRSYDLFQIAPFADGSNFTNQGPANVGDLSVKGIEFNINYDVVRSEDFNWNVNFNVNRFERRIEKLAGNLPLFVGFTGAGTGGTSQIHSVGFTPFSFFVFKQLYDDNGTPIEGAFADLNGDGIINLDDRYVYKNPDPDLVLGFNTSMNYKNFDLAFNLRASIGNRVLNTTRSTRAYSSIALNGVLQNVSPFVETTQFVNQSNETVLSDMFIENGSFLRMDFATLGYTFQKWLDGKASLRLFTGVQNPFIITKYNGLDPEINGGIDATIYPRQRQFLVGANIKF